MRSYRELWLWLGAAFLVLYAAFIAIGLAYFTKWDHFSFFTCWEWWASVAAFIFGFVCFACAILGVPFPPWTKPKFPNILLEINGAGDWVTTYEIPMGSRLNPMIKQTRLRSWRVRITNLEAEANASLSITLYVKLVPGGSRGQVGESIWTPPHWPIDPALGLKQLEMPIILEPGKTEGGDLVFEIDGYDLIKWDEVAQPLHKRFVITDHISGQRREIVTEYDLGSLGRDDMTLPTSPGIEILGKAYEKYPQEPKGESPESTSGDQTTEHPGQDDPDK